MSSTGDAGSQNHERASKDEPTSLTSASEASTIGPFPVYVTLEVFQEWLDAATSDFDSTQYDYDLTALETNLEDFSPSTYARAANFQYPVPITNIGAAQSPVQDFDSTNTFSNAYASSSSRTSPHSTENADYGATYSPSELFESQATPSGAFVPVRVDSPHYQSLECGDEDGYDSLNLHKNHTLASSMSEFASNNSLIPHATNYEPHSKDVYELSAEGSSTTKLSGTSPLTSGCHSTGVTREEPQRLNVDDDRSTGLAHASVILPPKTQEQSVLYVQQHSHKQTTLSFELTTRKILADGQPLEISDQSRVQIYPFPNGMTIRFINCGLITSHRVAKGWSTGHCRKLLQDREYYVVLPTVDGQSPPKAIYRPPFPAWDRAVARRNWPHWFNFVSRMTEVIGQEKVVECDGKMEPDVEILVMMRKKVRSPSGTVTLITVLREDEDREDETEG